MKKMSILSALTVYASSLFAGTYTIDAAHTGLNFSVKHMLVSKTKGEFNDFAGTLEFDGKDLNTVKFDVTVKASSIDTKNQKRDDHLRSPDFFDAEKFPEIKFVTTGVQKVTENTFELLGNFTIRDVTKSVVIPMTYNGSVVSPWGQTVVGFEGGFAVDRMEYGLTWNKLLETGGFVVDKTINISLEVEAVLK